MFAAEGLTHRDGDGVLRLDGVSLALHPGEIVGLAGVAGNGQSELLAALAGLIRPQAGLVRLDGRTLSPREREPGALRRLGVMHVPEDRLRQGLVPPFPAAENTILGYQDDADLGYGPLLSPAAAVTRCTRQMAAYDVRPPDPRLRTAKFSGGNQQKLVLAREIERAPRVLLVGQPTRGVDIGAIEFIHTRLLALREAGVAILLVSVELDEILALSDRVLVMCAGRVIGELAAEEADAHRLGLMMAGIASPPGAAEARA